MFSKRQLEDIEVSMFFIPSCLKSIEVTDLDKKMYLELSESGLHKEKIKSYNITDGFNALAQGKRWRGIHAHEMYEQGILDGSVPYIVLLEGMPRCVVNFLKKEMFKGVDSDLIESIYKSICLSN